MTWRDLSDSELEARLVNRGVHPDHAHGLVAEREDDEAERVISEVLGGGR